MYALLLLLVGVLPHTDVPIVHVDVLEVNDYYLEGYDADEEPCYWRQPTQLLFKRYIPELDRFVPHTSRAFQSLSAQATGEKRHQFEVARDIRFNENTRKYELRVEFPGGGAVMVYATTLTESRTFYDPMDRYGYNMGEEYMMQCYEEGYLPPEDDERQYHVDILYQAAHMHWVNQPMHVAKYIKRHKQKLKLQALRMGLNEPLIMPKTCKIPKAKKK